MGKDQYALCLVPGIDLLNHAAQPAVSVLLQRQGFAGAGPCLNIPQSGMYPWRDTAALLREVPGKAEEH